MTAWRSFPAERELSVAEARGSGECWKYNGVTWKLVTRFNSEADFTAFLGAFRSFHGDLGISCCKIEKFVLFKSVALCLKCCNLV